MILNSKPKTLFCWIQSVDSIIRIRLFAPVLSIEGSPRKVTGCDLKEGARCWNKFRYGENESRVRSLGLGEHKLRSIYDYLLLRSYPVVLYGVSQLRFAFSWPLNAVICISPLTFHGQQISVFAAFSVKRFFRPA
jgi:hypothetical protein